MAFDALNLTADLFPIAVNLKSKNSKVGPIPVSTSSAATCPPECPLKNAGCYADGGPLAIYWRKVSAGQHADSYSAFLDKIAALPAGQIWRHNQAGDLQPSPADPSAIDHAALIDLAMANRGRRGFSYTHFDPIHRPANARSIAAANAAGFTVNLSGNSVAHADQLAETKAGPVVTVLPVEYERKNKRGAWLETLPEYKARLATLPQETPAGHALAVCPATYTETNCAACQLCQRQSRKVIVGFPAHGFRTRKADLIAAGGAA